MSTRNERWNQKHRDKRIREYFPPRLQNDLHNFGHGTVPYKSCYIFGSAGTGKTVYAANLLLNRMKADFLAYRKASYLFITVPGMLTEVRGIYEHENITEKEIINKFSQIDVLVLDDFGVDKITHWAYQMLYQILNSRYEYQKETIFTSNRALQEIKENLRDDRIPSRIYQMCDNGQQLIVATTKHRMKE